MEKVLKMTHKIDGYTMQLKKAISKDQSRKKVVEEKFRKLFIVGLPQDAKKHHIREYFKKFGRIDDVRIIIDKMAKTSRGKFLKNFGSNFDNFRIWIRAVQRCENLEKSARYEH